MFAKSKRRQSCVERVGLGLGCALGLSLAGAALPEAAQACSQSYVAIDVSYPLDHEQNVPTNVVLFVDGPELDELAFELLDDLGGSLPIQVRAVAGGGFDIEPSAELAPNQTYTLRIPRFSEPRFDSMTFTTGGGPRAVPDTLAAPQWNPVMVSRDVATCGQQYSFCTGARAPGDATLEGSIGREALVVLPGGAIMMRPGANALADGECLTLRARDIRGHRSDPATICSDAMHRYDAGNGPDGSPLPVTSIDCDALVSSFAEAPQHEDGSDPSPMELGSTPAPTDIVSADSASSAGCALGLGSHGAAASGLALAGAVAAMMRRRRRFVR